jgi:hypothetical protein
MNLITKRDNRSVSLHIIAGAILIIVSSLGSYLATHSGVAHQAVVSQTQ